MHVRNAEDARFVHACDAVAGMRETGRQVAVVGQEQQTLGVVIQAPDRIHVFFDPTDQVDDCRTTLRIRPRRHVAARLVQQQVAMVFRQPDPASVDADVVARRVGLRAQLADGAAVHGDAAFEHEPLGGAARGNAGA